MTVLTALLLTTAFVLSTIPSPDNTDETPTPSGTLALSPHDPIYILGNAGFTNASGVVWGSGSGSDPYIISDWDINATSARGIHVQNTSSYFVVMACYVHDGLANMNTGIYLDNCTNGAVRDSNSSYNWYGMLLVNASCDNTLVNNTFSHNRYDGIELYPSSNRNIIRNNTFVRNLDGIHLESARHNIVDGNVMVDNGLTMIGYVLQDCTTNDIGAYNTVNGRPVLFYRNQSGMTVPTGAGGIILANCTDFIIENQDLNYAHAGIELLFSSNITVRDNTCTNNSYGILLWFSNSNYLINNTIHNSDVSPDDWWYGIGLGFSSGNTIRDNIITDCLYGVSLRFSSQNNTLSNNSYSDNSYGAYLSDSDYNEVSQNRIANNTYYGVWILSSVGNVIWNNTLIYNNGATDSFDAAHVQAYEFGAGNWWNSTDRYGNYWSDWTTPDANGDGIVDLPYPIDGVPGAWDYAPLANAPGEPIPEFGIMPLVVIMFLAMVALTRLAAGRKSP
jgi:parallel beta-helix repeat protein